MLSIFPLNCRYIFLDFVSSIVFVFCIQKRIAVTKNLQLVFGRKPTFGEVRKVFIEYGRYWAEFFDVKKLWMRKEKILENSEFPPKQRGFLGLTFHIGNFEMFGPALYQSLGENFNVVAERLSPDYLSDFFIKNRLRHNITTILHDNKRQILSLLNQGQSLGIVCDRVVGGKGIETKFFGKKVRLPLNIVSFALQKKIPIYVSYCVKERSVLRIYHERLKPDLCFEEAVKYITKILEDAVKRYPFQWHVLSAI